MTKALPPKLTWKEREDLRKKESHRLSNARWIAANPERAKAQVRALYPNKYAKLRSRMNELKTGPCMDCGGSFPPECMDFDHLRNKEGTVASMFSATTTRLHAEIAKCELVCSNCHRIRTFARKRANKKASAA